MKKILVISLIFFAAFSPLHLNNEYLRCSSFDTVTTRTGDTLLTIAEMKYRLEDALGLSVDVIHGPLKEDDIQAELFRCLYCLLPALAKSPKIDK